MTHCRTEKIKELFIKLKRGNEWYIRNQHDPEKVDSLMLRSEPLIDELEKLGVEKAFSWSLLIFGSEFVESLVSQFENEKKGGETHE